MLGMFLLFIASHDFKKLTNLGDVEIAKDLFKGVLKLSDTDVKDDIMDNMDDLFEDPDFYNSIAEASTNIDYYENPNLSEMVEDLLMDIADNMI